MPVLLSLCVFSLFVHCPIRADTVHPTARSIHSFATGSNPIQTSNASIKSCTHPQVGKKYVKLKLLVEVEQEAVQHAQSALQFYKTANNSSSSASGGNAGTP